MYGYDEVNEKILDENIIGGVEDMFYDFDSEKALAIWNKYCETELAHWQSVDDEDYEKVYHNTPAFFTDIEMKKKGLTADEILERIERSGKGYNPSDRYITLSCVHGYGINEYFYMTSNNATDLMDADPDFAIYLIGMYAENYGKTA